MAQPTLLDVFSQDAFSALTLSTAFSKTPFKPNYLGSIGLFEESGISTTDVAIEEYDGVLNLIPNTQRGAPSNQAAKPKCTMNKLTVPHLPLESRIVASEIQNNTVFGMPAMTMNAERKIAQRVQQMRPAHEATLEYGRVGAFKGIVLDADGLTVLFNYFTTFNVSQQTYDLTLGTSSASQVANSMNILNLIEDELGAVPYEGALALLGRTLWSRFITHSSVQTAYQYYLATGQNVQPLRDDSRFAGFQFGGITWRQYRGKVGGNAYIADTEGYVNPIGVPQQFITNFAPADFIETANTEGLPMYVKIALDPELQKWVKVYTESNPISINTRPRTSIKLTTSN